jgi:prophage regulatory protein
MKKTGWHAGVKAGVLPPPFYLSQRCAVVFDHELASIVAARAAGRTNDEVRALVVRMVAARQAVAAQQEVSA